MYYLIADDVQKMKTVRIQKTPSIAPDAFILTIEGAGILSLAGTLHDLGAFATELNRTVMAEMDREIERIENDIASREPADDPAKIQS
jgi:hypothetical protein